MASQAMQRLQHFNSQNISNTLWAFASLNHHPGPMLLKVLQRELVHMCCGPLQPSATTQASLHSHQAARHFHLVCWSVVHPPNPQGIEYVL